MKFIKYLIIACFILIIFSFNTDAQVDTTDWFPMHTGNYWEYMAITLDGPIYYSISILGDTLMLNGKEYKIFYQKYFENSDGTTWYFRKENNFIYQFYGDQIACSDLEYKYLDFSLVDSSIWAICRDATENARGIASTFWDNSYYNFLNKLNEAKQFEDVHLSTRDTIWTPSDGSFPIVLNKGIGIVWRVRFLDGSYYLQGAIINGVKMGTITDVDNEISLIPGSFSITSFPNPFNNSTTLKINLLESETTELSIYNILGQKLETIFNDYKSLGTHNIVFNANNLSSGIYIAILKQNKLIKTEKLILLK